MKHNINLGQERMPGQGVWYDGDGFQVNYLYGLDDFCKQFLKPDMKMLELGCHIGVSTNLFAKYVKSIDTVDMDAMIGIVDVVSKNNNVEFYHMTFHEFFNTLRFKSTQEPKTDLKYDVIYIDGSHDYHAVLEDINNSLQFLKPGGIIAGHDYNITTPGVPNAINHFLASLHPDTTLHIYGDSSWAIQLI